MEVYVVSYECETVMAYNKIFCNFILQGFLLYYYIHPSFCIVGSKDTTVPTKEAV